MTLHLDTSEHGSNPLAEIIAGLCNISKQHFEFGPTGDKNSYSSAYALSQRLLLRAWFQSVVLLFLKVVLRQGSF